MTHLMHEDAKKNKDVVKFPFGQQVVRHSLYKQCIHERLYKLLLYSMKFEVTTVVRQEIWHENEGDVVCECVHPHCDFLPVCRLSCFVLKLSYRGVHRVFRE